jgi:hypothetical protein
VRHGTRTAVATGLTELHLEKELSALGGLAVMMLNHRLTYVFVELSILIGMSVYFALYYLTFHYAWPQA